MNAALPLPLRIYAAAASLLAPLAPFLLERRARRGKEDRARMDERFGKPSRPRPDGRLVWVHGASVGETVSVLPVVEELTRRGVGVLVTSGTVTSAEVMEKRLPAGALHQYVPLDAPAFAKQFLDHWQPDCALFAESELWPNLIIAAHARNIPVMILNGRMSERSFQRWQKTPAIIRALLARIDVCLAQSADDAFRYGALGAANVQVPGNLKYDGPAPPADAVRLGILAGRIAGRPVWLAASTHRGEDEAVLQTHGAIAAQARNVLTIIV
ncbi:MAG: 3-deoxy-D-manno-octulosonic acid transferase, partial [Beijerinckiaceae bacterium]